MPNVFDASALKHESHLPDQFRWPDEELPSITRRDLSVPLIDLSRFDSGDEVATKEAIELVQKACEKHGVFLVANHGVDATLLDNALKCMDQFFGLPLSEKGKAKRVPGKLFGYSGSYIGRFSSKLPWKETFSVTHTAEDATDVKNYIQDALGAEFEQLGEVYQEYCEAMSQLSLVIMELLGLSLGIGRSFLRKFYEDNESLMRMNYYPLCKTPDQTLGTGPHTDPTSLTILNQDLVGGLEVFVDHEWHLVRPIPNTFVVNIGDTLKVLTNGKYKSCLHRAVVSSTAVRKSIAYFLCPKEDKVVLPPPEMVTAAQPRMYPSFTWSQLRDFTQFHYRADLQTLEFFTKWLQEKEPVQV